MASNSQTNIISTKLKIIQINVNSLIQISRRFELQQLIKKHNPDIVFLSETKLNAKHKIHFENYKVIRKDRKNAIQGGGTAILIKNNIKYSNYTNKDINSLKNLETCIIRIPMVSNTNLYLISAYYPSGNNNIHFKPDIQKLFESMNLQNDNNYYILAGDLNCKHTDWGNRTNNPKGSHLNEWLYDNDIQFRCKLYASSSPSFPRTGSYLDICIADCRLYIPTQNTTLNCLQVLDYDSDHNALEIVAYLNKEHEYFTFFEEELIYKFNYKNTNWSKFQNYIIQNLNNDTHIENNRNLTNNEIDFHLNKLNVIIEKAITDVVPKYKENDYITKITNSRIKMLYSEKSKILTIIKKHNRLEHTISETTLNYLKAKLKLVKKLINENIGISINKNIQEKLTNIDPMDSKNMFGQIKKNFKKIKPLNLHHINIPIDSEYLLINAGIDTRNLERDNLNNFVIQEQEQMLDTIGAYLESVHSHKEINHDNIIHDKVIEYFNWFLEIKNLFENNQNTLTNFCESMLSDNIDENQSNNFFVTRSNIIYIFSNLTNKLSSGIDNVPNIVLKKIPQTMIFDYCKLFNNMLNNSYFPIIWKTAKIVLLPKKGKDPSNVKNMRPISLLPNISKVFEICINNIMNKFCLDSNLISENQFGFKYKHSTTNAIHLLTSNINWNWNRKLYTGACFIDLEKAFDSVWIPGLIFKLLQYKFPLNQIILIYNMISQKNFMIYHKDAKSNKTFQIVNGLQQGTVNSPMLFNLYMLDLLKQVNNIIAFADDIVIYHADDKIEKINQNLQKSFDIVEKYTINWNMKINAQKCETILFRPPVDKCNSNIRKNWKQFGIKSNVSNCNIQNKEVVKYLGVYLDKFLYFNQHVKESLLKAKKAFFIYRPLFHSKFIKSRVKIIMYKSLIRPIITYGCPIWFNISPSYMEKIRIFERRCLRACTSLYRSAQSNYTKYISNKILYNSTNIIRIDNFIIHLIRNNILRCTQCTENNFIMAPYYINEIYITDSLKTGFVPPEAFIYLDKKKIIQNENGIPVLYHNHRRANIKAVNCNTQSLNIKYDTSISNIDLKFTQKINTKKFWWLNE